LEDKISITGSNLEQKAHGAIWYMYFLYQVLTINLTYYLTVTNLITKDILFLIYDQSQAGS
jgi:hypothetical protein